MRALGPLVTAVGALVLAAGIARAEPAPAPVPATPDAVSATNLLTQLTTTTDPAARKTAITTLDGLAPRAVDAIGAFLARDHAASIADRRAVLAAIKATVPDKNGHFVTPPRRTGKEAQADDDVDWLAELSQLDPATAGLGDVLADDVALRALAATKDVHAAQLIFNVAFAPETVIYRDECGRYLRKMEPASIPALTQESQGNGDRRTYATWQLERMDRQEPGKALGAMTGDEVLTIALLDAYRVTHHREAVQAVFGKINADSPRVRAAARATWMAYVTGPPPPPAPKKHLVLPGGKEDKKETALWLTYRELADVELRKASSELLHEDLPAPDAGHKGVPIDREDLTKRIFAYYDTERAKRDAGQWQAAKAKADAGDLAGATALLDPLLAANPDRGEPAERTAMAKVYLAWGKQLEGKQQWPDAGAAYSKAAGLDPQGADANAALAGEYFALGKTLEAQGKDGGAAFRRAVALKPDYAPTSSGAAHAAAAGGSHDHGGGDGGGGAHLGGRPVWMLYAAGAAAAFAALLAALGLVRRRA